jgi:hypothetical protein
MADQTRPAPAGWRALDRLVPLPHARSALRSMKASEVLVAAGVRRVSAQLSVGCVRVVRGGQEAWEGVLAVVV